MFKHDKKVERLRDIELFAECTMQELRTIASVADQVTARAGDVLRDSGRSLLLVTSGEADGDEGTLRAGDTLGSLAMLGAPTGAREARMKTDGTVLVVGRREFQSLIRRAPGFAIAIAKDAARHMARSA